MKEIIKKILEVVGSEDIAFIGTKEEAGIKTIKPNEIEVYPKKFKNIIVSDIEHLDKEKMRKLAEISECIWILTDMDKLMSKIDSSIESVIEKGEFKNIEEEEKIEILKDFMNGEANVVNFGFPELAIIISRKNVKIPTQIKRESFTSFLLNLSIVEYLKRKLEKVEIELELERERNKVLSDELGRLKREKEEIEARLREDLERMKREKDRLAKEMEIKRRKFEKEKREAEKRWRKEIVRLLKERKKLEEEKDKMRREKEEIEARLREDLERMKREKDRLAQNFEEKYKEELKKVVFEMGLKLEEKEKELERIRKEEKGS